MQPPNAIATPSSRNSAWLAPLSLLAALAALALPKLAPFVLVGSFLALLVLPTQRTARVLGWLAGALALLAFVRFLVFEAMPGIVQAGTRATEDGAVSRLREILFAEDALRRRAVIDPDHDGVGSAALLPELSGAVGLRAGPRLNPPVLEHYPDSVDTALGPAVEVGGYLFIVCLPARAGGFTARPGEAVDEELAERRFLAYAWPAAPQHGLVKAFFLDEHERILFAESPGPEALRARLGRERPPTCDDALAPATREAWQSWKGKLPRRSLPGQ